MHSRWDIGGGGRHSLSLLVSHLLPPAHKIYFSTNHNQLDIQPSSSIIQQPSNDDRDNAKSKRVGLDAEVGALAPASRTSMVEEDEGPTRCPNIKVFCHREGSQKLYHDDLRCHIYSPFTRMPSETPSFYAYEHRVCSPRHVRPELIRTSSR